MSHDRFDALSGAVALGEASEAERLEFAVHAAGCAACRADARCAPVLLRAIDAARDAETWRPTLDRSVLGRIRDSRSSRFRMTIGALGWAVALSIVLNLAFASGFSARLFGGFPAADESGDRTTAMTFSLESPEPRAPRAIVVRHSRVAFAPHRERSAHARVRPAPSARRAPATFVAPNASATDVPDLLAGLDIDGDDDRVKHVAVQPVRRCGGYESEPVAGETAATVPCPVSSAADLPR